MSKPTRISAFLAAVALTAVVGCAETSTREGTGQYVDDSVITSKVKAALFHDSSLHSHEINVETYKGRVQLSGFVRSRANMDQAVADAQGVSGVTSVANDMRLK